MWNPYHFPHTVYGGKDNDYLWIPNHFPHIVNGEMNNNYEAANEPGPWSLGFVSGSLSATFWRRN